MKKILIIILGNFMMALGLGAFILNHNIVAGGVSGFGQIFHLAFGLNISTVVSITNVLLFVAGTIVFKKEFAVKTILSTLLFPFFLDTIMSLPMFECMMPDLFVSAIIGSALVGFGSGMILNSGGSSGGFDIIAVILNHYKGVNVSSVIRIIDISILLGQCMLHSFEEIIYGLISIVVLTYALNYTLMQGKDLVSVMIMSDIYDELLQEIHTTLDAGATLFYGEKGYTHQDTKIILSAIPYRKLPLMKQAIKDKDPHAFIMISKIEEVGGNGFHHEI